MFLFLILLHVKNDTYILTVPVKEDTDLRKRPESFDRPVVCVSEHDQIERTMVKFLSV